MCVKKKKFKFILTIIILIALYIIFTNYNIYTLNKLLKDYLTESIYEGLKNKFFIQYFVFILLTISISIIITIVSVKYVRNKEIEKAHINNLTNFYTKEKFNLDSEEFSKNKDNIILVFMDLDNLKKINDTYGHDIGDIALKTFCEKFLAIGDNISCYRFGGDEFILIFREDDPKSNYYVDRIEKLSREYIKFKDPAKKDYLFIKFSFGIAKTSEDGYDAKELQKIADVRMYNMKKSRKEA